MGYDSTFSGELAPNKAIPKELAARINGATLDVRVAGDNDDYTAGTVVPAASTMHGYDFVEDVVKVSRFLAKHGISLSGDIVRKGEGEDDFDKIEVRRGKVYYRLGRITYGRREVRGEESVTRYAVRVFRIIKNVKGDRLKFLGWAGVLDMWGHSTMCPPQLIKGKPNMDRPPCPTHILKNKTDADDLVKQLTAAYGGRKAYETISWEDAL